MEAEAKGVYYGAGEGPPLEELNDAWSAWFVWSQTAARTTQGGSTRKRKGDER